jgi:hypothetical protein
MTNSPDGAILIVCADEQQAVELTSHLYEQGLSAVGPVACAAMALTLTAISGVKRAILAGPTNGRRDAVTLAQELTRTWGVECTFLPARDDEKRKPVVAAAA